MLSKYCDQADISKCEIKIGAEGGENFRPDSLKDFSKNGGVGDKSEVKLKAQFNDSMFKDDLN